MFKSKISPMLIEKKKTEVLSSIMWRTFILYRIASGRYNCFPFLLALYFDILSSSLLFSVYFLYFFFVCVESAQSFLAFFNFELIC